MMRISPYYQARGLILMAGVVSLLLAWWLARVLAVPPEPGFQGSLALQRNVVLSFLMCAGIVAAAAGIGTAIAGGVRFNAGLFAAGLALAALSWRGGPTRETFLYALAMRGPSEIFLMMAMEIVLLGLIIGGAWWVLRSMHVSGTLRDRESESMLDTPAHARAIEMTALAVQGAITAGGVVFLGQSDAKMQVMMAVGVGSWAGSAITHSIYATGPRSAYWAPPLVVGLLGYLMAALFLPRGVETANFQGVFVGLIWPLPLDWASAGVVGAVVGHWMSRRWLKERQAMGAGTEKPGVVTPG